MSINITEQTMEKNSTFKLIPSFKPIDASNQEVIYESSNSDVVTVDELGNVKAVNSGTAKITVTSKENSSIKAECNITVIISATSLTLSPKEKQIIVGESIQLSGTIEPGDVTSNALTWSSSNPNIATVNSSGLVTGVSAGEVIITATTVNGIEDTSKITVKEPIGKAVTAFNKTLAGNIPKGNFALGDEYIINVDGTNKYHFYVLSVEGDKVSLIMSNNICSDGTLATSTNSCSVVWISKLDYNDDANYGNNGSSTKGPITAMNYLHQATKNWNNIENIQINYTDNGNYGYGKMITTDNITKIETKDGTITATYTNLKARMPKLEEIGKTGCIGIGSCPAWMVNGLNSYTDKYSTTSKENINGISGYWSMTCSGNINYPNYVNYISFQGSSNSYHPNNSWGNGIRPVITTSKSNLS